MHFRDVGLAEEKPLHHGAGEQAANRKVHVQSANRDMISGQMSRMRRGQSEQCERGSIGREQDMPMPMA